MEFREGGGLPLGKVFRKTDGAADNEPGPLANLNDDAAHIFSKDAEINKQQKKQERNDHQGRCPAGYGSLAENFPPEGVENTAYRDQASHQADDDPDP